MRAGESARECVRIRVRRRRRRRHIIIRARAARRKRVAFIRAHPVAGVTTTALHTHVARTHQHTSRTPTVGPESRTRPIRVYGPRRERLTTLSFYLSPLSSLLLNVFYIILVFIMFYLF